jgi:hypothetical protein
MQMSFQILDGTLFQIVTQLPDAPMANPAPTPTTTTAEAVVVEAEHALEAAGDEQYIAAQDLRKYMKVVRISFNIYELTLPLDDTGATGDDSEDDREVNSSSDEG